MVRIVHLRCTMLIQILYLFCLIATVVSQDAPAHREVNTTSGWVRGFPGPSGVYEFLDIPYASAPTGPKKFGPPLPPPVWGEETLNATAKNIICPQPTSVAMDLTDRVMQEDCLVVSVFTPERVTVEKLPVVVYVHGGAFQAGEGNALKPYDLVRDHNLVGVTFNYRLGAHGFLCLGTDDVPGNAGLKDQVALLRWVQNNIEQFGGNPEDVTIAGYSAGGTSVDLLMLSKSSQGLFKKVIPESGSNLAIFAIDYDPLESAKDFARLLKFDNVDDIEALEEFYKTLTYDQMNPNENMGFRPDATFAFVPCVERPLSSDETGREVFLDTSPREILESKNYTQVPLLYGFTNMEGLIQIHTFDTWKTRMNENFTEFLPADLEFESPEEREVVAQRIRQFYFQNDTIDNSKVLDYIDYYTDVMFAYSTLRSAKIQVENGHNEIYLYEFNYVDENTMIVPHTEDVRGADHIAQTIAVFGGNFYGINLTMTEEYKTLVSSIQQIWANFIKTGKPVPEGSTNFTSWPPVTSSWSPHMSIGNVIELKGALLPERASFWEEIYGRYYREPRPPIPDPVEENSAGRNTAWITYSSFILLAIFRGQLGL